MAKKPKKVSFGMCRDITLKHHDTWANGGGRRSAMSYSKHFLDIHGDEFDVYRITRRLILEDHQILREEHNFSNSALNRYNSAVRMPLIFCQEEWEIIDQDWTIPKFKRYSYVHPKLFLTIKFSYSTGLVISTLYLIYDSVSSIILEERFSLLYKN